jgi:hypothetical protein
MEVQEEWLKDFEYTSKEYSHHGEYVEINVGAGDWSDRELSEMLSDYFLENEHLFE